MPSFLRKLFGKTKPEIVERRRERAREKPDGSESTVSLATSRRVSRRASQTHVGRRPLQRDDSERDRRSTFNNADLSRAVSAGKGLQSEEGVRVHRRRERVPSNSQEYAILDAPPPARKRFMEPAGKYDAYRPHAPVVQPAKLAETSRMIKRWTMTVSTMEHGLPSRSVTRRSYPALHSRGLDSTDRLDARTDHEGELTILRITKEELKAWKASLLKEKVETGENRFDNGMPTPEELQVHRQLEGLFQQRLLEIGELDNRLTKAIETKQRELWTLPMDTGTEATAMNADTEKLVPAISQGHGVDIMIERPSSTSVLREDRRARRRNGRKSMPMIRDNHEYAPSLPQKPLEYLPAAQGVQSEPSTQPKNAVLSYRIIGDSERPMRDAIRSPPTSAPILQMPLSQVSEETRATRIAPLAQWWPPPPQPTQTPGLSIPNSQSELSAVPKVTTAEPLRIPPWSNKIQPQVIPAVSSSSRQEHPSRSSTMKETTRSGVVGSSLSPEPAGSPWPYRPLSLRSFNSHAHEHDSVALSGAQIAYTGPVNPPLPPKTAIAPSSTGCECYICKPKILPAPTPPSPAVVPAPTGCDRSFCKPSVDPVPKPRNEEYAPPACDCSWCKPPEVAKSVPATIQQDEKAAPVVLGGVLSYSADSVEAAEPMQKKPVVDVTGPSKLEPRHMPGRPPSYGSRSLKAGKARPVKAEVDRIRPDYLPKTGTAKFDAITAKP